MSEPDERVEFDTMTDAVEWCKDCATKTGHTFHIYERCSFYAVTKEVAEVWRLKGEVLALAPSPREVP